MSIDIHVPTLGESISDATIARWIKKAGEAVAADEPIVELETDKVTLEVPSPVAGKLGEIIAAEGAAQGGGAAHASSRDRYGTDSGCREHTWGDWTRCCSGKGCY